MVRVIRPSSSSSWAVVGAAVVVLAGIAGAAPVTFTSAVLLQTPAGGNADAFDGYDSSSAGYGAAGESDDAGGNDHAVRWAADGTPIRLGGVPGQTTGTSYAHGVNASGQVAGCASLVSLGTRAVVWGADGSAAVLLGDLQGQTTRSSIAYGINDAGQVAGAITPSGVALPVRWGADGSATALGMVTGQIRGLAYGISGNGRTAGFGGIGGATHAVRWDVDGSETVLGDVPGKTTTLSLAYGINNAGVAVGYAQFSNYPFRDLTLAVRWGADGSAALLGDLPGLTSDASTAVGITDGGLVGGDIAVPSGGSFDNQYAVIWDAAGSAWRLQDLMADGHTWTFSYIAGIDANGSGIGVVAFGTEDGGPERWYMVSTTVPEPTCVGEVALAGGALVRRRRRG